VVHLGRWPRLVCAEPLALWRHANWAERLRASSPTRSRGWRSVQPTPRPKGPAAYQPSPASWDSPPEYSWAKGRAAISEEEPPRGRRHAVDASFAAENESLAGNLSVARSPRHGEVARVQAFPGPKAQPHTSPAQRAGIRQREYIRAEGPKHGPSPPVSRHGLSHIWTRRIAHWRRRRPRDSPGAKN
jgi:hypothetical protein